MIKDKEIVGIDISKATFNVHSESMGDKEFSNDEKGFKQLERKLKENSWLVMEATGSYHQSLAIYLHDRKHKVSVINPLVIKRFIQMKLHKLKTDKSDARMIAKYGEEQELQEWKPDPEYIQECKLLNGTLSLYYKQRTSLKNKLHSIESMGSKHRLLKTSIKRHIQSLEKEMELLEKEMEHLIKENEGELLTKIQSIPGIGKKTAMLLIAGTNGFKRFEHAGQVSSYLGLAPQERTSGSSIRGRSRIAKRGNSKIRNHLFMCSFTACEYNPQCKALYERIVAKGKSKKLALIAVMNKLIKQSFAIAKSGVEYNPEYRSVRPMN